MKSIIVFVFMLSMALLAAAAPKAKNCHLIKDPHANAVCKSYCGKSGYLLGECGKSGICLCKKSKSHKKN
ncbi:hypothetical protein J3Q64DRAFT_1714812 [Phycomyces blakesleeanus]